MLLEMNDKFAVLVRKFPLFWAWSQPLMFGCENKIVKLPNYQKFDDYWFWNWGNLDYPRSLLDGGENILHKEGVEQ